MEDKHTLYNKLVQLGVNYRNCTKVALINIVFPTWDELDVINKIFNQSVKTKECPTGLVYDEDDYRVVLRIYNGRLYDDNDRPDAYCWSKEDFLKKSKNIQLIGTNSPQAVLNLCSILNTMTNKDEKLKLAGMFSSLNRNLLYIESKAEDRIVVEITKELYDKGITSCIDRWTSPDDKGNYPITNLEIGDYLVIHHEDKTLYRIEKDVFLDTHIFK